MRLIEWSQFIKSGLPPEKPAAFTVGVFDGVHRGHKAIIGRIVERADSAAPVIVTFRESRHKKSRSPDYPGDIYRGDIMSFRQKTAAFEKLGVHAVIVIDFSESFRKTGGLEFLKILLEKGRMAFLAVGSNFRCGFGRDTDARKIKEFCVESNIPVDIVEPLMEDGAPISSSHIRAAVAGGRLKAASLMLGYPFTLDLGGASPVKFKRDEVYDLSESGRVLPPDGGYRAFLLDKDGGRLGAESEEIFVEAGTVRISGNVSGVRAEYAEFVV